MRQRTDFSVKNVNSVNTYYGLSRNIKLVFILAFATFCLVVMGFSRLFSRNRIGGAAFPVIMILIGVALGVLAYFVYKKVKPTFILEIETYLPNSVIRNNAFQYGNATVDFSKKKLSILHYILVFPALFSLLKKSKSNKYVFVMEPEIGNDIVNTLGPFLLEK